MKTTRTTQWQANWSFAGVGETIYGIAAFLISLRKGGSTHGCSRLVDPDNHHPPCSIFRQPEDGRGGAQTCEADGFLMSDECNWFRERN